MENSPEISILVILWPLIVVAVLQVLLRTSRRSVGFIAFYLLIYTITYWLASAFQSLSSYFPLQDPFYTRLGFTVSFVGLVCFIAGVLITQFVFRRTRLSHSIPVILSPQPQVSTSVPLIFYSIGIVSYFALSSFVANIPTISAVAYNASNLLFVGAILMLSHKTSKSLPRWIILVSVFVWPVVTVVNGGFLGFGLSPSILTLICWFQISGRKLRLHHFILAAFGIYIAFSVVATYFVARNDIRGLVWTSAASDIRISGVFDSFVQNFQFFGFGDAQRLAFIEGRLDLSNLTGVAIARLNTNQIDFANGGTLTQAALMVIPRSFWPDRPVVVGGNDLISKYTGITFASGTTVAPGQVMELYINFGLLGIIVGFAVLGGAVAFLDQRAAKAFDSGNYFGFAAYVMPMLGLVLVGDTMIAVVATTVTGAGTALLVNFVVRRALVNSPRAGMLSTPTQSTVVGQQERAKDILRFKDHAHVG